VTSTVGANITVELHSTQWGLYKFISPLRQQIIFRIYYDFARVSGDSVAGRSGEPSSLFRTPSGRLPNDRPATQEADEPRADMT